MTPDHNVTRCGGCGSWAFIHKPCPGCDNPAVMAPYRWRA